jgi:predicted transcriptional regulator
MINTTVSDDRNAMAAAVSRYNIKHFCKRLAEETGRTKQQTIFNLIAEEKAKLNALMDLPDMRPGVIKRVVAE